MVSRYLSGGRGYYYKDKFFWDYWRFSGGLDGAMTVGNGRDAVTFMGKLPEAKVEEFEYVPARRKVRTGILKAGKVIRRPGGFTIREASLDDPIYKRGFVIGGRILRSSTTEAKGQTLSDENQKQHSPIDRDDPISVWLEEGIYGAAKHQMSGSEEQDLSTGQDKKGKKTYHFIS